MINNSELDELDLARKIEIMHAPISDEEFYTFFIEKTDIWVKCSQQQKDFIKKIYPTCDANHYEISRALAKGFSKKNSYYEDMENDAKSAI
jgi:hypothetical protein